MRFLRLATLVLAGLIWCSPAMAQTVTDGDKIELNGVTWRLWGIDAPEAKQWCGDYPAGVLARTALEKLMTGRRIACDSHATDRYGRNIGLCSADGDDLSAAMVRLGMAWAFMRYSSDYIILEAKANAEHLGVHAHRCVPAWEWRANRKMPERDG